MGIIVPLLLYPIHPRTPFMVPFRLVPISRFHSFPTIRAFSTSTSPSDGGNTYIDWSSRNIDPGAGWALSIIWRVFSERESSHSQRWERPTNLLHGGAAMLHRAPSPVQLCAPRPPILSCFIRKRTGGTTSCGCRGADPTS